MKDLMRSLLLLTSAVGITCLAGVTARGDEKPALRAEWITPPRCRPFDPVRIKDLTEELHETGYRLVIAIHPARRSGPDGVYPPRDLYVINADGTGLKQLTNTPEKDERVPRTSPDGRMFTYNYGDYLVDVDTLKTRDHWGGYVWTRDSKQTVYCEKNRLVYTDIDLKHRGTEITAVIRRQFSLCPPCLGVFILLSVHLSRPDGPQSYFFARSVCQIVS